MNKLGNWLIVADSIEGGPENRAKGQSPNKGLGMNASEGETFPSQRKVKHHRIHTNNAPVHQTK